MRIDVRFVGVKANEILIRRIYEHFEQILGDCVKHVEYVELKIGNEATSNGLDSAVGEGVVVLKDGTSLRVTSPSSKLMTLIDGCVEKLEAHFQAAASGANGFSEFRGTLIPTLASLQ